MSINAITIVGRMTKDPEQRTTATGKNVASFTVAVDKRFKKDGEQADFFRCQVWGQQAEFLTTYGGKGRLVAVTGRMESRKYADKDSGANREIWELQAENVALLDRPREDAGTPKQSTAEYDPFSDE